MALRRRDDKDIEFADDMSENDIPIRMHLDHSYDPEYIEDDFEDGFEDEFEDNFDDVYEEYPEDVDIDSDYVEEDLYDDSELRPEKPVKKVKNSQIMAILYGFLVLFFCMIGYFIYFDVIQSENVTNNPNNVRIAKLSDTVVRGQILSSNGDVLAQTLIDENGEEYRDYPYDNMFAHVVGASHTNKSGLESTNEYHLLRSSINPMSQIINEFRDEKSPGDNLRTTLNVNLQKVAYEALGNNQGVVIAMEPTTGKILAMVSKPDYNPNTLVEDFEQIISVPGSKVLLNQATNGMFAPGSIFKMVTALEYMKEYPNYSSYSYTCHGSITLDEGGGQSVLTCFNSHVHGTEDLTSSFADSCNASFANIGLNLNTTSLNNLADALYFNQSLPTAIPHAKSSFSLSAEASQWLIGATAIGQGDTAITPLHALLLTSAIANGGVVMEPYLVDSIINANGTRVENFSPKMSGSIMTTSEAALLKDMMRTVVTSGTATALNNQSYAVAGKTGTAEVDNAGNNAWFVGFAPADAPQIAICVLVEDSDSSSSYTAVPIAKQVFDAYFN